MMPANRFSRTLPIAILLIGLLTTFLAAGAVQAQEQPPQGPSDNEVNAIAKQTLLPGM